MCGRYSLTAPPELIAELFGLAKPPDLTPRYNIAPTQEAPVIRREGDRRVLAPLRWGLVPPWAEDPTGGGRMINARSETVTTRPAYREAFRRRRCLVPADGFFEWRRGGGRAQPFFLRRRDGRPMALAGIWERWQGPGEALESFAILTTDANELVAPLHDRMPAIVPPEAFAGWLDPATDAAGELAPLLRPRPPGELEAYPVDPWVNDPAHDDARCLEPVADEGTDGAMDGDHTGAPSDPQGRLFDP
jgi:putative SOS response-associated peptidase YedK